MRRTTSRAAFTLIELLVVITIIAILAGMLLVGVQSVRRAGKQTQCVNNLKQLGLALHSYHNTFDTLPYATEFDPNETINSSAKFKANWIIRILPFVEQQPLYDSFNLKKFISDPENRTARSTELTVLVCPMETNQNVPFSGDGGDWARGNYAANGGLGHQNGAAKNWKTGSYWKPRIVKGVMGCNVSLKLDYIGDGQSNTLMLSEVRVGLTDQDRRGTWAMGTAGASALFAHGHSGDSNGPNNCAAGQQADDIKGCNNISAIFKEDECMTCCVGCDSHQAAPRSKHMGGVNACMGDASVHFISDLIDHGPAWETCCDSGDILRRVWDQINASNDGVPVDMSSVLGQ